jgi:hypothetical protein
LKTNHLATLPVEARFTVGADVINSPVATFNPELAVYQPKEHFRCCRFKWKSFPQAANTEQSKLGRLCKKEKNVSSIK